MTKVIYNFTTSVDSVFGHYSYTFKCSNCGCWATPGLGSCRSCKAPLEWLSREACGKLHEENMKLETDALRNLTQQTY